MLLGRERELAELRRLLDGARAGRGGAILISGDAGIGKTALWRAAVGEAIDLGLLEAIGIESESHLAFAGLRDLLAPLLDRLNQLPAPQRDGLTGALALGPPAPGDPFAVAAATLGLLGVAGPSVAVIDDAHWLDPPSAEALLFAARRLRGEPVAMIFVARTGEEGVFARGGLPTLLLGGLDHEAALAVVRRAAPDVSADVAETVVEVAGGNPLALEEIPRALRDRQRTGAQSLPDPMLVGPNLLAVIARRLEGLPEATRQALTIAAASGAGELATVRSALSTLGYPRDVLEPAERAEILELESRRVEFRHPLLRAGAYELADPPARRAAHSALAAVTDDPERRAWHRAAASTGPDAPVADELACVAEEVAARGAAITAARALERAAELTPDEGTTARRRLRAAQLAVLAGRLDRASDLLGAIDGTVADSALSAEAENLRGTILRARGSIAQARRHQVAAARIVAPEDPELAALIAMNAYFSDTMSGDLPAALELAARAAELVPRDATVSRAMANSGLAMIRYLLGERPIGRRPSVPGAHAEPVSTRPGSASTARIVFDLQATSWTRYAEEHPSGPLEIMGGLIAQARTAGALGVLPYHLANQAELLIRAGELAAAARSASEAAELARDTGARNFLALALVILARAEALLGTKSECLDHLAETRVVGGELGLGSVLTMAAAAEGLLHLGARRIEPSLKAFEEVARRLARQRLGAPAVVPWRPDYIEALARAGQVDQAQCELAILEEQSERCDSGWARAAAARARILLCEEDELDAQHERAAAVEDPVDSPLDRARFELCYGERLRRAGRRRDAVAPLTFALDVFEQIGAVPWADRAAGALGTMGERAGETLTAQELEVARLVGAGASNKEVAAALYVTPKTVEAHLTRIYRKLGVRRRGQLARFASSERTTDAQPRM